MNDRRWQTGLASSLATRRMTGSRLSQGGYRRNFITKLFIPSVTLLVGWAGVLQEGAIADTIVEIRGGTATIDRTNPRHRQSAQPGMSLVAGDLIYPGAGAVVEIRCSNGNFRQVRSLVGLGDICPESLGQLYPRNGRGENDFLLFLNDLFDYATQVVDAQPELRWSPVEGATSYRVQMLQNDELVWEETVSNTSLTYGGELEPGESYTLIVTAVDGSGIGQRLLLRRISEEEVTEVQEAAVQIEAAELSEEGRAIALAQVYQQVAQPTTLPPEGAGLVLELIPVLEAVIESGSQNAYLHGLLGNLYLQVGLVEDAQHQYEETIWLTTTRQDLLSRAASWVGLANIAAIAGDKARADEYLQLAQVNYGAIANNERVERIDEWLNKLNRELP